MPFEKYSKGIPGILQGYEKDFIKSKIPKTFFVGYCLKLLIFWKCVKNVYTDAWQLDKKWNYNNIIISTYKSFLPVYQCVARSRKCLQFMCFWHAIWQHVTIFFLISVIAVARHYQRQWSNFPPIGHVPAQSQQQNY